MAGEQTPKAGAVLWRIGARSKQPLRCIFLRSRGGDVLVKASRFARNEEVVITSDLFTDRDECRAEIQRRANATKEPAP